MRKIAPAVRRHRGEWFFFALAVGLLWPASAVNAAGGHDSVVAPLKPLTLTLGSGATELLKAIKVSVRNADSEDADPGHEIRLDVSDDCPAGTVGAVDFDPDTPGAQSSVTIAGGKKAGVKVPLRLTRGAFTSHSRKAPLRCHVTFTAVSVGSEDPNPVNNVSTAELNLIDGAATASTYPPHETVLASLKPLTLKMGGGAFFKTIVASVSNADVLPTAETPGHTVTLTAENGTCPPGTVNSISFVEASGAPDTAIVEGGSRAKASVRLIVEPGAFGGTSKASPGRCTALLRATGPDNPDSDASNNTAQLVIDVVDAAPTWTATPTPTSTPTATPTGPKLRIAGNCLRPGPRGAQPPCNTGTVIDASHCTDDACSSKTWIASATVQADEGTGVNSGRFEIVVAPVPPLPSNRIELRNRTNSFRQILTYSPDGTPGLTSRTGSRGRRDVPEDPDVVIEDAIVDPSSEGTASTFDAAGLENVGDDDIGDLDLQTRSDTRADYTGLSEAAAAQRAEEVALDLFTISPMQIAIRPDGAVGYVLAFEKALLVVAGNEAGDFWTVQTLRDGVDGLSCFNGASVLSVSPDSRTVYVGSRPISQLTPGRICVFSSDATSGALTLLATVYNNRDGVSGLSFPRGIAFTADGSRAYVASDGAVLVFDRNTLDGTLTHRQTLQNGDGAVAGLTSSTSVALSPGEEHVYVTGSTQGTVVVFDRDPLDGTLSFNQLVQNGVGGVTDIPGPSAIVIAPDGEHAYVANSGGSSMAAFSRDDTSGQLSYLTSIPLSAAAQLVQRDANLYAVNYGALNVIDLDGDGLPSLAQSVPQPDARCLAVHPNGLSVFVCNQVVNVGNPLGIKSVAVFGRNPADGTVSLVRFVQGYLRRSPLQMAESVTTTSDGAFVYATSPLDEAVTAFVRRDDSTLELVDIERDDQFAAMWPDGVSVSPDDRHVYVASNQLDVYARDASTGKLSRIQQVSNGNQTGVIGGHHVLVSPDGANVYVAGGQYDELNEFHGSIGVFARDLATGQVTSLEVQRNGLGGISGLSDPASLAISPDGAWLYAACGGNSSALTIFQRGAEGRLTYVGNLPGRENFVVLSPDGSFAYTAGFEGLTGYSRDALTGQLTEIQTIVNLPSNPDPLSTYAVAISPDGRNLYVPTYYPVGLAVFARDSGTGLLSLLELQLPGQNGVDGLEGSRGVAVSGDGAQVYVTGADNDAIAVFDRDATTGALTFVQARR